MRSGAVGKVAGSTGGPSSPSRDSGGAGTRSAGADEVSLVISQLAARQAVTGGGAAGGAMIKLADIATVQGVPDQETWAAVKVAFAAQAESVETLSQELAVAKARLGRLSLDGGEAHAQVRGGVWRFSGFTECCALERQECRA
jgi:hypothetical protein